MRKKTHNAWTLKEEQHLIDYNHRSQRQLAKELKRSFGAVNNRCAYLRKQGRLPKTTHGTNWTAAEIEIAREWAIQHGNRKDRSELYAKIQYRTKEAIDMRLMAVKRGL